MEIGNISIHPILFIFLFYIQNTESKRKFISNNIYAKYKIAWLREIFYYDSYVLFKEESWYAFSCK
jgi:hypothetical protein